MVLRRSALVALVLPAGLVLEATINAPAPRSGGRGDQPMTSTPTALAPRLSDPLRASEAERPDRVNRGLLDRDRQRTPATKRSRSRESGPPAWLEGCAAADAGEAHPNGRLPDDELCTLPISSGQSLHPDAARAWWRLNWAFKSRFGHDVCVTDSYRSLEAQQQVYVTKPGLAAAPGTSNHGWGVAADLCGGVESYTSQQHAWLRVEGPRFGWDNPSWARVDGSRPEPWHWEFVP